MSNTDPFDDFWDEESADSTPRRGRPRIRQTREKGPIGRPRIRPLEQKYARKRGRPALNHGSIADRIEKEGIVGGTYSDKIVAGSFKNFDKSVALLQKGVVAPLSKSINAFSKSVNDFNKFHQQYLKDQIAFAKDMHETFKLMRKTSLEPLIRAGARTNRGTREIIKAMDEVYKNNNGQYSREYKEMYARLKTFDKNLEQTVKTASVGVLGVDTFLKEYYRTSKNTSKFLNAVSYAVEDVAEDIESLKNNMSKYFKGKNTNKSILQDQSESLKRIEKNTKQPTLARRAISAAISTAIAAATTMFRFNRYGTMDLIGKMFGQKNGINFDELKKGKGFLSKIFNVWDDAIAVQTREKVYRKDNKSKQMKLHWTADGSLVDEAYIGGHGKIAQKAAEGYETFKQGWNKVIVGNFKAVGNQIKEAWSKSPSKERFEWFFEVARTMGVNWWNREGAKGQREVNAFITNMGKKHPYKNGSQKITNPEDFFRTINRAVENFTPDDFSWNSASTLPFLYDPRGNGGGLWTSGSNAMKPTGGSQRGAKIYDFKNYKARKKDPNAGWGNGPSIVTLDPKSESTISSVNVSNPRKAQSSLLKIQGRMLGYIEKLWKSVKGAGSEVKEKSSGLLGKLAGMLGAGGLAAWAMKNRKLLGKGGKLAGLGSLIFGGHALKRGWAGKAVGAGKWAGLRNLGATSKVLWNTFGWGNAKHGADALAMFKRTKLGSSALGTFIRQAKVAAAGGGTGLGSRLFGGLIHANKWGGIGDPLGIASGIFHGAGGRFVKQEGKLLPKLMWDGRKNLNFAKNAGKAGSGVAAKIGQRFKDIKKLEFIAAHPQIAQKVGTGVVGKATAKVAGAGAAIWGAGKGLAGGIGKAMTKIPSKDKVLGGILKVAGGGAALKAIGKLGGKSVGKALAKQIPILGALIGIGFGIHRFTKGEIIPGILEIVSGLLTLVPSGVGNAAALAIDVGLAGYDINKHMKKDNKTDKKLKKMKGGKETQKKLAQEAAKATGPVGAAAISKAVGSEVNPVSEAQKTPAELGGSSRIDGDPRARSSHYGGGGIVAAMNKAGATLSRKANTAGKVIQTAFTGPAEGEKTTVTKDTGAISWNGNKHDKLMPEFATKLYSAADEMYKKTGHRLNVTSAIRTNEKQAELWVRGRILKEKGIFTPAQPALDTTITYKGKQYKVKGKGQRTRTGHMAGGAVDVSNWNEFKPYAQKYGISWQGAADPVHFQINKAGPVITSNVNTYKPQQGTSNGNQQVGDGSPTLSNSSVPVSSGGSGGAGAPSSNSTEISPMIQDWGLAIVNNLLFAS